MSSCSHDGFFHRAEVFHFNKVQLVNYFTDHAFDVVADKSSPYSRSSRKPSCYLLEVLFRFVIHWKLSFVRGIKSVSRSILLYADVQLFQHRWLKSLSLPRCTTLLFCQRSVAHVWGSSLLSIGPIHLSVCPLTNSTLFQYCCFLVSLEAEQCRSSNFVSLQYWVGSSASFIFNTDFRINLLISTK